MPLNCMVYSKEPLLLFIHATSETLDTKDIETFYVFFKKYIENDKQFKIFIDLRQIKDVSLQIIKELLKDIVYFINKAEKKVLATSVLISSKAIENAINLIFTFKKPLTPTKITCSLDEACNFLNV